MQEYRCVRALALSQLSAGLSQLPVTSFTSVILGMSVSQVHDVGRDLVKPLDGNSSFWAASTYVILDEETRSNNDTCLLVFDLEEKLETQRFEFKFALFGLVPVNMMLPGLAQCSQGEIFTTEISPREDGGDVSKRKTYGSLPEPNSSDNEAVRD